MYRAVFTNSYASVPTDAVTLSVLTPPAITTQPASQSVIAGTTVTFSATVSGNPAPTVQWQISADGGSIFNDIPGATADSYSLSAALTNNGNEYQAVFTNSAGSVTTLPATLAVSTVTPITLKPTIAASTLPAMVVGGTAVRGIETVDLTNATSQLERGLESTSIYAIFDGSASDSPVLVTTQKLRVSMKAGATRVLRIRINSLPASLASGVYSLFAETVDPTGNSTLSANGPTVHVAAPFVEPAVSIASVTPSVIRSGRIGSVVVTISNSGNIPTTGRGTVVLGILADGSMAATHFKPSAYSLRIQPGKSLRLRLRFSTSKQPAGTYLAEVQLTLDGSAVSAVSSNPFTIG